MFNTIASKDTPKSFKDFYLGQWVHPIRTAKKYPVAFTCCQLIGFAAGIIAARALVDGYGARCEREYLTDRLLKATDTAQEHFDSPIETVYTPTSYGRIIPDIDDIAMEVESLHG